MHRSDAPTPVDVALPTGDEVPTGAEAADDDADSADADAEVSMPKLEPPEDDAPSHAAGTSQPCSTRTVSTFQRAKDPNASSLGE